jgi:coenzyme F420-reducing hydrogenase beta subunit
MQFNVNGEYNPVLEMECKTQCGLCLEVCPFYNHGKSENDIALSMYGNFEDIKYRNETGYYLKSYVGYSYAFRNKGASGGIGTWFLTYLLENNIVDYVICVTPQDNPDKLFNFRLCRKPTLHFILAYYFKKDKSPEYYSSQENT